MAHPIAESFRRAAELVAANPLRQGNLLHLDGEDDVVFAGDIHGHRQNLARIIAYADVAARPKRRLVLQEIIHGGPTTPEGADRSFEVLLRAIRLKIAHPDRVCFLMGNHDVAQFTGNEITKSGMGVCKAFDMGLELSFGPSAEEVRDAVYAFLAAMPLAAVCPNGMLLSHSMPTPDRMKVMDWDVFGRPYAPKDFCRGGGVYEWTWGRNHSAEQLHAIGERLGVRQFLIGHQPVREGFEIQHGRAVILSSDSPHGAIMAFNAGTHTPDDELPALIRPIAALG
ncbi:MAG TPA: metallophosphoesterase [Phycisphaerae bacterium]|nr:metallophosphoesterase [Phycisphaerae bacterium]